MYSFADFAAKFPPVNMPVTLGEDTHHVFSVQNAPLPQEMVEQFILPTEPEGEVEDEFTEYIACFTIDEGAKYVAIVWWKAALLHYEYVLATFTSAGKLIERRTIAYTTVSEEKVVRAVATIDADLAIFIAEGAASGETNDFDPVSSQIRTLEIMDDGAIVDS